MREDINKKSLTNVPKPPEKPKSSGMRVFTKPLETRVYLLEGVDRVYALVNKDGEPIDETGKVLSDPYVKDNNGESMAGGRFGWPIEFDSKEDYVIAEDALWGWVSVPAWYPGNFAVLLAPVKNVHDNEFLRLTGNTLGQALNKILMVLHNQRSAALTQGSSDPVKPYNVDENGITTIPGIGTMFGDVKANMAQLVAFLLSAHGQIIPNSNYTGYDTIPTSVEEVNRRMPLNFIDEFVEDGITVFDEVLQVSTVYDFEAVREEIRMSGDITESEDDELKNFQSRSETDVSNKEQLKALDEISV